jgi:nicotinamidase-related amidase
MALGVNRPGDWVIDTKKRYDCFIGTDLDFLLRTHGINTVFITGVNTNSCVLSTACAACSRDYAVVVIEDCVDTMDGPALHEAALACIRSAFGTVMRSDEIHKLQGLKK